MASSKNTRKLLEISISNIPESYNPQALIIKGEKSDPCRQIRTVKLGRFESSSLTIIVKPYLSWRLIDPCCQSRRTKLGRF